VRAGDRDSASRDDPWQVSARVSRVVAVPPWPELAVGRSVRYPARTVVVRQGDECDALFLVEEGAVKLVRSENQQREVIVAVRFPKWLLGCAAGLLGQPYPADVVTLSECRMRPVTLTDFNRLRESNIQFASAVERALAIEIFEQVAGIGMFALDVRKRLRYVLDRLGRSCGKVQADGSVTLDLHLTQHDLADLVTASREKVNRLLKEFETQGSIRRSRGWIVLTAMRQRRAPDIADSIRQRLRP
jgi:CRP/FNR family transcriptional regulator, cyclic AMP receptor protein